jgi:hypothetical protein
MIYLILLIDMIINFKTKYFNQVNHLNHKNHGSDKNY